MPKFIETRGKYYRVVGETDTHYTAYTVGGGFECSIPKDEATPAEPKSNWQQVLTSVCEDVPMKAWADLNYRWNGWLDPYFEKDTILGYMQDNGFTMVQESDKEIEFSSPDNNTFVTAYEIEAAGKTLWNISGWCWELEPEEVCSMT